MSDAVTNEFPAEVAQQPRNALSPIDIVLQQAGASPADVIISRLRQRYGGGVGRYARRGRGFADIRPTSTFLICQIPALGARVEIEVTASTAGR